MMPAMPVSATYSSTSNSGCRKQSNDCASMGSARLSFSISAKVLSRSWPGRMPTIRPLAVRQGLTAVRRAVDRVRGGLAELAEALGAVLPLDVLRADQVDDQEHRLDVLGQHRLDGPAQLGAEVIHHKEYRRSARPLNDSAAARYPALT